MAILGPNGKAVVKKELEREIAAPSLTGVRNVWHEAVSAGLSPRKLATMLRAAQEGDITEYLTLAEEMEEREAHYRAVLSTRKLALAGLEPVILAANEDDKKAVDITADVRELVQAPAFWELIFDLTDAFAKGYSVVEIDWKTQSSRWVPQRYIWRDPRFFMFDAVTGSILRVLDDDDDAGIPLPPYKFITHIPKFKSGVPIRGGLAMLAAWSYVFKSYTVKDWLAFAEAYGLPIRLGKYAPGASQEDVDTLVRAVSNIGTDSAAVIPEGMNIEFIRGATVGGDRIFSTLVEWIDKQISKAVLGQTMTTDSGSSEAQSRVHDGVRKDILRADARQLAAAVNRDLIRPYVDLNYGPQEHYPVFALPVTEAEDITALVNNVAKLLPAGLAVSTAEIRSKLGLSEPDEGEPVLSLTPASSEGGALNRQEQVWRARNAEQETVDELEQMRAEQLADWESVMAPVVDPVRQLVERSETLQDALDGLETLQTTMDSAELMRQLASLTFMARGLGDGGA